MKKPQTKLVLNKGASIKKVIRLTESQFRKLVKVMSESVLDPQGEKDQPLRHSPGIGNDPDNLESSDELWNFDEFQSHTDKQLNYGERPDTDDIDHPYNSSPWVTKSKT
jgi:predicted DNA-binding antitoxin AbrB/MazE fold protein